MGRAIVNLMVLTLLGAPYLSRSPAFHGGECFWYLFVGIIIVILEFLSSLNGLCTWLLPIVCAGVSSSSIAS